jgi:hypothetical protein
MEQRSQRGAAKVSAVWLIVVVVFFFVALAFGYISNEETVAANKAADDAGRAEVIADGKLTAKTQEARDITEKLGFNDDQVIGSLSNLEAAQVGIDNLKAAFSDTDDTTNNYETLVPVVIRQYNGLLTLIAQKDATNADLQTQLATARESVATVSATKDAESRDLRTRLTDAENQAAEDKTALEADVASARSDRNDKDSQVRTLRGEYEDLSREAEKERLAHAARTDAMSKPLKFLKEPERPDGRVLAVSSTLGIGWINIGSKNRLDRGMVFHVVDGKPNSDSLKGWAEVTDVDESRAEVRFFDLADPYDPIVADDIIYNPVFDPTGERNAVLIGRFSGSYNEKQMSMLLADIGISVQKNVDAVTDYLIVGSEIYTDEDGEPYEDPLQPSELPAYKEAVATGVRIVPVREVRRYFKK